MSTYNTLPSAALSRQEAQQQQQPSIEFKHPQQNEKFQMLFRIYAYHIYGEVYIVGNAYKCQLSSKKCSQITTTCFQTIAKRRFKLTYTRSNEQITAVDQNFRPHTDVN